MIRCEFGGRDSDIVFAQTPRAMINRLLPVITTDATIAAYVNRHFGTSVKAARIKELRALWEAGSKKANPDNLYSLLGEPIGPTPQDKAIKADAEGGCLMLARAIRAAHPDRGMMG